MKLFISWLLGSMAVLLMLTTSSFSAEEKSPTKEDLLKRWQQMFSDKLTPPDNPHFQALVWVGPQPEASMSKFEDKRLSDLTVKWSSTWVSRFLRNDIKLEVTATAPARYFISTHKEPSLLQYEWTAKDKNFTMTESGNAVLIQVRSNGLIENGEVAAAPLADLIFQTLNLNYKDAEALRADFKLPKKVLEGSFFTNASPLHSGLNGDWKGMIVGFVGRDSIGLICFKTTDGLAAQAMEYHPHWLGNGAIEETPATQPIAR